MSDYKPLIDYSKSKSEHKRKCSCLWGVGWAVFAALCSVAVIYKLIERGVF